MENTNSDKLLSIHLCGYDFEIGSEFISVMHTHAFFQMNLVCSGSGEVETPLLRQAVGAGDIILTPPGCPHCLHPGRNRDFCDYSFKFFLDRTQFRMPEYPVVTEPEQRERQLVLIQSLGRVFGALAPPELFGQPKEFPLPTDLPGIEVLEGMLLGFCRLVCNVENASGSPFLRKVKQLVQSRRGKAVSVAECAEHQGCSAGHLLSVLRRETGMTAKEIIDRERIAIAKRFLAYSDITISQLAARMEFNDLIYFGKFFKKYTGETPRGYRSRRRSAGREL